MTKEELNIIWTLNKKFRCLKAKIETLRMSVTNLTPIINGLPKTKEAKSYVEKLALDIVEKERECEKLRVQIEQAKVKLINRIFTEENDTIWQTFLVLRYVECLQIKEVAKRMNFCVRYLYKLSERSLR